VEALPFPGDDAPLHQVDDPVGEHLGVHAQVLLLVQVGQDGVGHAAVADLDGRPVRDQVGHVLPDARGGAGDLPLTGELQDRLVVLHEVIDLLEVQPAVPAQAGHVGVDLGDDHVSMHGRGHGDVHGNPQVAIPVRIGRGYLDKRHVHRLQPAGEQPLDVREVHRRVIRPPLVHRPSYVRPDEEGVQTELVAELVLGVEGQSQRKRLDDLAVDHGVGFGQQSLH